MFVFTQAGHWLGKSRDTCRPERFPTAEILLKGGGESWVLGSELELA